jgi:hypothetical protein
VSWAQLAPYLAAPEPPEDWPVLLWKNCVCLPANATAVVSPGVSVFSPPEAFATTQFRGQPLYAFRQFMLAHRDKDVHDDDD